MMMIIIIIINNNNNSNVSSPLASNISTKNVAECLVNWLVDNWILTCGQINLVISGRGRRVHSLLESESF